MNKLSLLFALVLIACSSPARADNPQPVALAQEAMLETATAQPATLTPEPTVDYQATSAYWATQAASDRQAALDSREAELSARAAEQAAGVAIAQMTQDAEQLQATVTAEANNAQATAQTANQTQTALLVAATATGQANMNILLKQQTDFARAEREAKTATQNIIVGAAFAFALILFLAWLFLSVIYHLREQEKAPVTPVHVTHITNAHPGGYGTTRRISDPPGDTEKIRAWAVAALAGESIAVDPWEASGIFTKNREYRHGVYAWVMAHKFDTINAKGERVLSEEGMITMSDWLVRHPFPVSDNNPVEPPPPTVDTVTVGTE
jgi:hypothetical protein